jgi:dihydrofolate synthase / folylpolyglutamate synthase
LRRVEAHCAVELLSAKKAIGSSREGRDTALMPVTCMKKYEKAVGGLDALVNYEKKGFKNSEKFDLKRMRAASRKLYHPENAYVTVHIAGTKGKGSVATFAASILKEAGMSTGLYTSPHLSSPRERIRLNGKMISERDFAGSFFGVQEALGGGAAKLTYFEMITLMAMWYFRFRKAEAAVFETGLGGRLDATNVLKPIVCGITPISYDHTNVLGNSLGEIAREKADIIKKGAVCVSSPQESAALRQIKNRCARVGARLLLAGKEVRSDIKKMSSTGSVFDVITPLRKYAGCRTVMPGEFQAENAAVALAICEEMWRVTRPGEIRADAVKRGIKNAFLAGRMEVLSAGPDVVIDGAQNAASASRLAGSIKKIFRYDKLLLIVAFCDDKDIRGACDALGKIADVIIVTRARTKRAANPEKIAVCFGAKKVIMASNAETALGRAFSIAGKGDLILAAGSFYLAAEIREIMKAGKD